MFGSLGRCYLGIALACVACSLAAAELDVIKGVVADEQDLPVAGVQVTCSCRGQVLSTVTDTEGKFSLSYRNITSDCTLSFVFPGFSTITQQPTPGAMRIRLQVAPRRDDVSVSSSPDDTGLLASRTLTSAVLTHRELESISNNTGDLITYSSRVAGLDSTPPAVHVNGLPSNQLPPAHRIERIIVNGDPFSAEFADGEHSFVDVITKPGDRKVRFSLPSLGMNAGGHNPLNSEARSSTHSAGFGFSAPIPRLPVAISSYARLASGEYDTPVLATAPGAFHDQPGKLVTSASGSYLLSLNGDYTGFEGIRTYFSHFESASHATNAGAGGIVTESAASNSEVRSQETHASFVRFTGSRVMRGGVTWNSSSSRLESNSQEPGLTILDSFVGGGSMIGRSEADRVRWTAKWVVQAPRWTAGFSLAQSRLSDRITPNPGGALQFHGWSEYEAARNGAPTGTWFLLRGNGSAQFSSIAAAPFVQADVVRSSNLVVTTGLRADYQRPDSLELSPRISTAVRIHHVILRAGSAWFVQSWPDQMFLKSILNGPAQLRQLVANGVSLLADPQSGVATTPAVQFAIQDHLVRPKELMTKVSLERPLGRTSPGLEFTWTGARHLLGLRRLPDGLDWTDLFESNRSAERFRINARWLLRWRGQTLTAHYQWLSSHDDTDGFLSYPEDSGNLAAEWAPSTGLSPHTVTLVAALKTPFKTSLSIVQSFRSSAPYNITTGRSDRADGLFTSRDGLPRNSGSGPSYHSVSAYLHRRINVPLGKRTLSANLGLMGDNLLGTRNYLAYGSIKDSSLFGKPIGALPGRSVRFWVSFH